MMKIRMKWPLMIALLSMLLLITACGKNGGNVTNQTLNTGQTAMNQGKAAPMFDLKDLNGNEVALADLAGDKVYVKYWASWCSICLAGLDELNTLSAQDNDFKVISIVSPDFNGEQSTEDFTKWFKKQTSDQDITVLIDENGKWAKQFGVRGYPTSYYIGSDGVLAKTAPGHNSNEQIVSTINEIN
ncbi:redoxin family protein [Paenibacillus sp. FA6]|uniref:redoxin family protein n=1 Tax=Paenibacillus sp. FA6 TaxID=3413029 RepID=UPI003F65BCCD